MFLCTLSKIFRPCIFSLYSFALPFNAVAPDRHVDVENWRYFIQTIDKLDFTLFLNEEIGKLLSGNKTLATYLSRGICTDSQ